MSDALTHTNIQLKLFYILLNHTCSDCLVELPASCSKNPIIKPLCAVQPSNWPFINSFGPKSEHLIITLRLPYGFYLGFIAPRNLKITIFLCGLPVILCGKKKSILSFLVKTN